MITWQGLGFLAVFTWLAPLMVVWGYTDRTLLWPSIVGHVVAVAATYAAGRALNRDGIKHYCCGVRFEYAGFLASGICAAVFALSLLAKAPAQ